VRRESNRRPPAGPKSLDSGTLRQCCSGTSHLVGLRFKPKFRKRILEHGTVPKNSGSCPSIKGSNSSRLVRVSVIIIIMGFPSIMCFSAPNFLTAHSTAHLLSSSRPKSSLHRTIAGVHRSFGCLVREPRTGQNLSTSFVVAQGRLFSLKSYRLELYRIVPKPVL
jgi:hypothetical protein